MKLRSTTGSNSSQADYSAWKLARNAFSSTAWNMLSIASLLLILILAQGHAQAQDQPAATPASAPVATPDAAQASEPTLTLRSQKALEGFEPSATEEYTLGAGDEITLDFPGHPELAGQHTLGPDGMITLNIVGAVKVADLTRDQAAKSIDTAMAQYYNDPAVTVKIDKYSSNRVRVIGYVQHPGEITFEETPTLLDAIGRAGLITPSVTANGVQSNIGPGIPETCTIYRGNSTVAVEVNLRELLMSGNALADMRLRRNDIVFVPEPKHSFVSVLGQVSKPGSVPLTPESTLTTVLSEAGCCTDQGGFNPTIHILQRSTGKDVKIDYKKLMTLAGQDEITLHPGDVILIPESGFQKAAAVLQKLSPVATMVSLAALVGAG